MKKLSAESGLSLVGLLIGLLISVLCILGSLSLYKNLIQVATVSKVDSQHDGQMAAALLFAQLGLQSAGYGIADADGDDVVRVPYSSATPTIGEKLLWRSAEANGGSLKCRGLVEEQTTDSDGLVYRQLKLIEATSGCTTSAALPSVGWPPGGTVVARWLVAPNGTLKSYLTSNTTLFKFNVASAVCTPFGTDTSVTAKHILVTVEAPGSALVNGATGITTNKYFYCLSNTYPVS